MGGGYVSCKCRDCFEIAIEASEGEGAYCHDCESAGCADYEREDGEHDCECSREDVYGCEDEDEDEASA